MKIVYPYNEVLPKKTAHDIYIFNECIALANNGAEVHLLSGHGTPLNKVLSAHYQVEIPSSFHLQRLPILRKNLGLPFSWNWPFFFFSQKKIDQIKPDWVICSVLKQAHFHFTRTRHARRLYEVHQLAHYPTAPGHPDKIEIEKQVLNQADLVTVTTNALKDILLKAPYCLKTPIEVIPLGVKTASLQSPSPNPLTCAYVGQLYEGQGIPILLKAWQSLVGVKLKIIGGKPKEVQELKQKIFSLGLQDQILCTGFIPPSEIASHLQDTHAFIAPFEAKERMPYVAHTKLLEYAEWSRPIVASDLPVTRSHFEKSGGVLFVRPEDPVALASAVNSLKEPLLLARLQQEIESLKGLHGWEQRAQKILSLLSS